MEFLIKVSRDTHPSIFAHNVFRDHNSVSIFSDEDLNTVYKSVYNDGTSDIRRIKDMHTYDILKLMMIYEYCSLNSSSHQRLLEHLKPLYDLHAKNRLITVYNNAKKERNRLQEEYRDRFIGLDNLRLQTLIAIKRVMLYDASGDIRNLYALFEYNESDALIINRLTHFFDSINFTHSDDDDRAICITAYSYNKQYIGTYNTKTKIYATYLYEGAVCSLHPDTIDSLYEFIMQLYTEAIECNHTPVLLKPHEVQTNLSPTQE